MLTRATGRGSRSVFSFIFCLALLLLLLPTLAQGQQPEDLSAYLAVSTANERSTLNNVARTVTSTADVTITNTSTRSITAPLHGVITMSASGVQMPEALGGPGTTPYGKYYYDLGGKLSGGKLPPGGKVTFGVKFVRASTARFTYTVLPFGILAPAAAPAVAAPTAVEFGTVMEGQSVLNDVTVSNTGAATLEVSQATLDGTGFSWPAGGAPSLPFTLSPGQSTNLQVDFAPGSGTGGATLEGTLSLESNGGNVRVLLSGNAAAPVVLRTLTVMDARVRNGAVHDQITGSSCASVGGEVSFGAGSLSTDTFEVTLTDQTGASASSTSFAATDGVGVATFGGINACGLKDGTIAVTVTVSDGSSLGAMTGTPAAKNTSTLAAPVLKPVDPATVFSAIKVCGEAPANTLVQISGGSAAASIQLAGGQTSFCLDVALRRNTENILIASATDPVSGLVATAAPVKVNQVDPSSVAIAQASSRPLTQGEVETLVKNGVIDLNDPSNFNVSMFTIVLNIGGGSGGGSGFPVTITQPVVVNPAPGTVSYGGGGGWSGGGAGGGGSGGGVGGDQPATGRSMQVVVIQTPTGQTIPGVIIIDGRIRTLKEFFQVTIAIQNTTTQFNLTDMVAGIALPAGLSPVKAGPGTDVAGINTGSATDTVAMGAIAPQQTGTGQFIIRGDGIGTHDVSVNFQGFLSGGGLANPFPISGSAATSVQVFGPPKLDVVVRHPGNPASSDADVTAGAIYTMTVEITNRSPVPALYASLELLMGQGAVLVDADGNEIAGSSTVRNLGHIQPGQTVSQAFRVKSRLTGKIIACQAVVSENINLTVDIGGGSCNIANTIPVNFQFPPVNAPPTVMASNPLNNQPNIPITSSVLAILTPQSACLTPDTWNNVVTDWIDPSDHSKGIQVVSADLAGVGTFYLEEMDSFNSPVRHIPTDLILTPGADGKTTIAVLRPGLATPLGQYLLKPNTAYRATLVGGAGGICNRNLSSVTLENTFRWTFSTEQACTGIAAPVVTMSQPLDGSVDQPLNRKIVLDFSNRMSPSTFTYEAGSPLNSSFIVLSGGTVSGGDVVGGTIVPGSAAFSGLFKTFTYTPTGNLPQDTPIHVRLKGLLRDVCGNPLQTPPGGIKLFSFRTVSPDTTPPLPPVINPLPAVTNQTNIQVSGSAEAGAIVTVTGGTSAVSTTASGAGLFSVNVPLGLNAASSLQVMAKDASGNESGAVSSDKNGAPLTVLNDATALQVASVSIQDGATNVPRNAVITVTMSEPIKPGTVNGLNFKLEGSDVPGSFTLIDATTFNFTPTALLDFNKSYTIRMRAGGISDLAGNGLASEFVRTFSTTVNASGAISLANFEVGKEMQANPVIIFTPAPAAGTVVSITSSDAARLLLSTSPTVAGTGNLSYTMGGGVAIGDLYAQALAGSGTATITVIAPGYTPITATATLRPSGFVITTANFGTVAGDPDTTVTVAARMLNDALSPMAAGQVRGGFIANVPIASSIPAVGTIVTSPVAIAGGTGSNTTTFHPVTGGSTVISLTPPAGFSTPTSGQGIMATVVGKVITLNAPTTTLVTRGSYGFSVSLAAPAAPGGQVIDLGVSIGGIVTIPATVTVPEGSTSVGFNVETGLGTGAVTLTASAPGFTSDSKGLNVSRRNFTLASPLVGIDRTVTATITLDQPAPDGGATFTLSVADTSVASVSPASITIPAGQTVGTFQLTGGLAIGFTTVTADGTANGYVGRTLNITVTNRLIDVPAANDAPLGSTLSVPVLIAPDPAPAGGVEIAVTSSNPAIVEVLTPSVTIPEGTFQAIIQVRAATGGTGSATITAGNPGFAPDTMQVTVTTGLNILESFAAFGSTETDTPHVQLVSGNKPFPAPAGGVQVALSSSDSSCVAVSSPLTIAEGATFGMASLSYGGTAVLPCTATVTATNALFGTDKVQVTVGQAPDLGSMTISDISGSSNRVGAGLQTYYRVTLATANHGGVTVQVKSGNPAAARLSANAITAGSPVVELAVPNGQNSIDFYVQGVRGATGSSTLTARATRFTAATTTATVVQPVLRIYALSTSTTTLSYDNEFHVDTGILNAAGTSYQRSQNVSGAEPLPVIFTSSNPAVGQLSKTAATGASLTIEIPVNYSSSPTTKATGGIAFDPLIAGATTVAVSAPGFNDAWNEASQTVTVNQATMTIPDATGIGNRIGASLQVRYSVDLGYYSTNHGGVTVHVESSDSSKVRLSTSATTAGTAGIDIVIPNGQRYGYFYVQGVRGATGTATLTATQALFTTATTTITVVQPVLRISSLTTATTTLSVDDDFYVSIGILNAGGTGIQQWQDVSGEGPLPVTFTSGNPAVGQMAKTGVTGGSVTIDIPVDWNNSPTTKAAGGVAFDPLAGGTTMVAATAPGFNNGWGEASLAVAVDQPAMTIPDATGVGNRVGASLQVRYSVDLGETVTKHGGVTVHVESSDSGKVRLSTLATTAGSAGIDIAIADGERYGYFYVQGVPGTTGSATLTATQALFTTATTTITVVQPVIRFSSGSCGYYCYYYYGPPSSTTTLSGDHELQVDIGILNASGTGFQQNQNVSGEEPLPVTFTSSNPAVGQMAKTGATGSSLTIDIPVNNWRSPYGRASGGIAFDPLTGGTTTVTVTAPGFNNAWSEASRTVTVTPPSMSIPDAPNNGNRIGASFQVQYSVVLGAGNHGGVTVHVESSDSGKVRLSTSATTAGSGAIDIAIADGQRYGYFYVQGVPGATGSATLTATQALFATATTTITVFQPAMTIHDTTGIGNRIGGSLQVRYSVNLGTGNHGGVTVHVESSDSGKVRLSTSATTAGSAGIDIAIPDGQSYGYFYVQGVRGATGTATLTATQALFSTATANITVVQPVLRIYSMTTSTTALSADDDFAVDTGILNAAGTGIQQWQVVSGEGPLSVTLTSSNPAVGKLSKTGESGASVTVNIPVNQADTPTTKAAGGVAFDPLTGGITTVTATAPGFNNAWSEASQTVTVTQTAITITDPGSYSRVGGGLQDEFRLTLGGSAHGGVTVRVASSDTTRTLLAADATTPGTSFIDLFIPDGQTTKDFYVQGINGVNGTVTLTATNPLFTTGTASVDVVTSIVQIVGLSTTMAVSSASDAFYVRTGILNAAGTSIETYQPVSPVGPVQVLLTSSNALVARLLTNVAVGAQVTVSVPINSSYSPSTKTAGGVEFDPLTTGATTVSATVNGFNNGWSGAMASVAVTP